MVTPLKAFLSTIPELHEMPRGEIRALKQKSYRDCLARLRDSLAGERLHTLTCATSASKGRGVLALTDARLVLHTERTGCTEWLLCDIESVRIRFAKFTYPAAIYLQSGPATDVLLVGIGRTWGPVFGDLVRNAIGPAPMAIAA